MRDAKLWPVRTTLDLDDDVLAAAKAIARRERRTAGEVVSELARRSLTARRSTPQAEFLGFRPLSADGNVVTNDAVNGLRDELEI